MGDYYITRSLSRSFPLSLQHPAHYRERAEMISVVIGDQQCLAQNCLATSVRYFGEEIDGRIGD